MKTFRKTTKEDIPAIMEIIAQAQQYMKEQGIDQWQNGYPNEEAFERDIENGNSYVLEEEGAIVATTAIIFDGEPTYDRIYEGAWKTTDIPYAAIHRVAVDASRKGEGLGGILIQETEKLCRERNVKTMKNDTHRDNLSMQRMVTKNGFEYCGIIYLADGAERLAYEKKVNEK